MLRRMMTMTELDKVAMNIYKALGNTEGVSEVTQELRKGHHVTNIEIEPDGMRGNVDGLFITYG